MCSRCDLKHAVEEALHSVDQAEQARVSRNTRAVEDSVAADAATVTYLFEALDALGLRVSGIPTLDELEDALAYFPGDVRVVVTRLPKGAGGRLKGLLPRRNDSPPDTG